MPFSDPTVQREYQRRWIARRRDDWIRENGPCQFCGSSTDLQIDHIEPHEKISHRVFSWSKERRMAELAKCQILCRPCHLAKTKSNYETVHGEEHRLSFLTSSQVFEIRRRSDAGEPQAGIADHFGISRYLVSKIVLRKNWKHL